MSSSSTKAITLWLVFGILFCFWYILWTPTEGSPSTTQVKFFMPPLDAKNFADRVIAFRQSSVLPPFDGASVLRDTFPQGTAPVFVANFGCGNSGLDPLNSALKSISDSAALRVRGLFVDPKECVLPLASGLDYVHEALGPEAAAQGVSQAFKRHNIPAGGFWALKVDVDSVDCGIMARVLAEDNLPAVVIIETMGCFPPPVRFSFISSTHSMAHEPFSATEHRERDWPNNCCLYSCSVQKALDVAAKAKGAAYFPVRISDGDVWFVAEHASSLLSRSTLAMVDADLVRGNAAAAFAREDAGMMRGPLSVYNLHLEYMEKWTKGFSGSNAVQHVTTFGDVCSTFHSRCSHSRLAASTYQLSMDAEGDFVCPHHDATAQTA